jgi:hypothetical protein
MHGLLAAGTDIWVREVARKTLGQRYVPATVRYPVGVSQSVSNSVTSFFSL